MNSKLIIFDSQLYLIITHSLLFFSILTFSLRIALSLFHAKVYYRNVIKDLNFKFYAISSASKLRRNNRNRNDIQHCSAKSAEVTLKYFCLVLRDNTI